MLADWIGHAAWSLAPQAVLIAGMQASWHEYMPATLCDDKTPGITRGQSD